MDFWKARLQGLLLMRGSDSVAVLLKNASHIFCGNVGVGLISFCQGIVVARGLGVADFGVLAAIISLSGTVRGVLGFRTSEPLTRYFVTHRLRDEKKLAAFLVMLALMADFGVGILAFVVGALLARFAALHIAGGSASTLAYQVFAVTGIFAFADATWLSLMRDSDRFSTIATVPVWVALLRMSAAMGLYILGQMQVMNLVIVLTVISAIQCIIYCYGICVHLRGLLSHSPGIADLREAFRSRAMFPGFWSFMSITCGSTLTSSLVKSADVMVLGLFCAESTLGCYRLAKSAIGMFQNSAQTIGTVLYQDLNEMIQNSTHDRIHDLVKKLSGVWIPVMMATAIAMAMLWKPLVQIVYGPDFLPSLSPFLVMLLGSAFYMSIFWVHPLGLALDCAGKFLRLTTWICLGGFLSMFLTAKCFGSAGVAGSVAISWVISSSLMARIVWKKWTQLGLSAGNESARQVG